MLAKPQVSVYPSEVRWNESGSCSTQRQLRSTTWAPSTRRLNHYHRFGVLVRLAGLEGDRCRHSVASHGHCAM